MKYHIQYDNQDEDLITRLFKIRNISDNHDDFLDPKIAFHWIDPFLLNDMQKAVDRIIKAIKGNEKIMIFGDYDVDGVTSSYTLYSFFKDFLNYNFISIQFPDRLKDGYGLKSYHLDEIKTKGVSLVITVDNGITSINESLHAKEIGLDLIITDHHHALDQIPQAFAVVNPQVSPNYPFKGLAGVGVAFKLLNAIMTQTKYDEVKRGEIFNYFLPIVAIGTVADIVPLIGENRAIVKRGLELMNKSRNNLPKSLRGFLEFVNIKDDVDTFHIGFVIGPRINAGGRISSPYDSLNTLLYSGAKQLEYLEKIDSLNTERKRLQEEAFKFAQKNVNLDKKILIIHNQDFHEGVVGIVAGRLTEQNHKPSMIMSTNEKSGNAVASLRGPDYFNVIDMIKSAGELLERFGGHKGAGGLSVKIENIDKLKAHFEKYCDDNIKDSDLEKNIYVDTKLYNHERDNDVLSKIDKLAPFGQGNEEPIFLIENIDIQKVEKIGKRGNGHLKIHSTFGNQKITTMFRSKGADAEEFKYEKCNIIGKIKKDSYNGGYFVDGIGIV